MNKYLPALQEVVKSLSLDPKKSLGQNFIFDFNVLNKIVNRAGDLTDKTILEIGPGPGGLTRCILEKNIKKLYVVEHDQRFRVALEQIKDIYGDKLEIIIDNALKIKEEDLTNDKLIIISNLPYNISTELLFKWLDKVNLIERMCLMFQKEVAKRITADPSTKSYGKISIITQWLCNVQHQFDLPPNVFYPPPKVNSSVITINPRAKPLFEVSRKSLNKICEILFSKRRKMLRVSLKDLNINIENYMEQSGIKPTIRPEELTIEQMCYLAKLLP